MRWQSSIAIVCNRCTPGQASVLAVGLPVEATDTGRAIAQDLRRSGTHRIVLQVCRHDKDARFLAQSARPESGQAHVPADAPWLATWPDEILAFPNGAHDDQVDSTSQALHHSPAACTR